MTGSCTAKNSRTTWVRRCRGTTWGHKTKYSHTNTVKDKVRKKVVTQNTTERVASETAEEREIRLLTLRANATARIESESVPEPERASSSAETFSVYFRGIKG